MRFKVYFLLQWASVASWFFRPECPQMSTPSSTSQPTVTSSTSTACSTKSQISYSNIFASNRQFQPGQHRDQSGSGNREESSQRIIQAPTICTVGFFFKYTYILKIPTREELLMYFFWDVIVLNILKNK